jgi:cytochrome c553
MSRLYASFFFAFIVSIAASTAQPSFAQSVDAAKGQQRAAVCTACHGQDGNTTASPGIPRLAGQDRDYLIKALMAYRVGVTRTDETMTAMAKPLSDSDIVNIAAYFSDLPPRRP